MIKVFLLDADGVTLKKQGYFSEIYSKEYGVAVEKIMPFFKNEFRNCQLGKSDLKEVLPKYLAEWGWEKSVEDFLGYWFNSNTMADEEVINKIQSIRAGGIICYLATDQDKYRAEYIKNNLHYKDKFDGFFFSCELGYSKVTPDFFKAVVSKLGLVPADIFFLDDEDENIESAKKVGIQAKFYNNLSDLEYEK